jgi:AhpD family alkylhydroperoxidase
MTPFVVHDLETVPAGARARLESVRKAWGFIPKLQGTLAESPVALEAYDTLFGLVGKTSLTPQEQQIVFIAVSVENGCEYCTMGHTYLARSAKAPEEAIQAVRTGQPIPDAKLEALRHFAQAVVRQRGHVGDPAVETFLAAGYDRANVLEVVTIVATKTISNYVNHITHTPKESFMSDPARAWRAPAA